jgi:hypothetical protein
MTCASLLGDLQQTVTQTFVTDPRRGGVVDGEVRRVVRMHAGSDNNELLEE